jgi:hypothetical protein
LTPRDSAAELRATAALEPSKFLGSPRLFRAQWQDILEAAVESLRKHESDPECMANMILEDVAAFLRRRGLEYFRGFKLRLLSAMAEQHGHFYDAELRFTGFRRRMLELEDSGIGKFFGKLGVFSGYKHGDDLRLFRIVRGRWI